jgi:hypothetical protein
MRRPRRSRALDVTFPETKSTDRHSIIIGSPTRYIASVWAEAELIDAGVPIIR